MKSKKDKMLPDINNGTNLPASGDSVGALLSDIFSTLSPGESTNLQVKRNRDDSATLSCPEKGRTLVKRASGNDVGYSYKPKKK